MSPFTSPLTSSAHQTKARWSTEFRESIAPCAVDIRMSKCGAPPISFPIVQHYPFPGWPAVIDVLTGESIFATTTRHLAVATRLSFRVALDFRKVLAQNTNCFVETPRTPSAFLPGVNALIFASRPHLSIEIHFREMPGRVFHEHLVLYNAFLVGPS